MTRSVTNGGAQRPHENHALPVRFAPIIEAKDHDAPSVFRPSNMLREARRQKGVADGSLPKICVLDPDGDIVRYLRRTSRPERSRHWACYHTELWEQRIASERLGFVGCAVGGSFAVLVAEQLFASGCELVISISSAGQIAEAGPPPYTILIERALRDEGTSYHYLPPTSHADADPTLVDLADRAFASGGRSVLRGTTWTTDAPFRETSEAIEAHRRDGILAVEMEAASLYAFAAATGNAVLCLAHVTNQLGCVEGDFEKGEDDGAGAALGLLADVASAWRRDPGRVGYVEGACMKRRCALVVGLLLSSPAVQAQQPTPLGMSLAEGAARRWPQPVMVGRLLNRRVLQPLESQPTLGWVHAVVARQDGGIDVVVDYGGLLGFFARPIAVPVEAMVLLGEYMEIVDFKPAQLDGFKTFDVADAIALSPDRVIRVGLARPSH